MRIWVVEIWKSDRWAVWYLTPSMSGTKKGAIEIKNFWNGIYPNDKLRVKPYRREDK